MISTIFEFIGMFATIITLVLIGAFFFDNFSQIESNRQQIDLLWSEMRNNNDRIHENVNFLDKRIDYLFEAKEKENKE